MFKGSKEYTDKGDLVFVGNSKRAKSKETLKCI